MIWIKYREKFSSGLGNWEYHYFFDSLISDELIEEYFINEKIGECSWSEHFRGIDWERTIPPIEIVNQHIKEIEDAISGYTKCLNELDFFKKNLYILEKQ